jgi:hypothetical protein
VRPEWRVRARTAPGPHAQRAARKLGPHGGACAAALTSTRERSACAWPMWNLHR